MRFVPVARHIEKIFENRQAMFGANALRMKLHALDRQRFVSDAHDFTVVGPRGDSETVWKTGALDDQRVVARGHEVLRQPRKQPMVVVVDGRYFSKVKRSQVRQIIDGALNGFEQIEMVHSTYLQHTVLS